VYAFEKNKSIPVMAQKHVEKALVISIDLKDFFHSITQKQVLETMKIMGLGAPAALTVSEICTYKFFVPQGALTSPKIANIISAYSFGPLVKEYCDSNGLDVTIYADDITISTNNTDISPAQIIQSISTFIRAVGFRVNHEKTKIMRSSRRQYVCGVVVNKKTNLMKRERNKLRAIVHNVVSNGVEVEAAKTSTAVSTFMSHLKGKINWFRQLNEAKGQVLFDKISEYEQTLKDDKDLENVLEPLTVIDEYEMVVPVESSAEVELPWT
jgi:retron-type reverse transcriptase